MTRWSIASLALLCSCSFFLERPPATPPPPGTQLGCASVVLPAWDTAVTLAALVFDGYIAHYLMTTHDDGAGLALIPAIPVTAVGIASGAGAIFGWHRSSQCRAMER